MNHCFTGDCRDTMRNLIAAGVKVQMCVTSPPYWGLRDYGHDGQLGMEATLPEFVANLVEVFSLVWKLLHDDGVVWLILGDSYAGRGGQSPQSGKIFKGRARQRENICISARNSAAGLKAKNLIGVPWRVAFALQDAGWYLREDIIWFKPNPMTESVTDRCTRAHEYVFHLSKSPKYFHDAAAIAEAASYPEGARNKRPREVPNQRTGVNANLGGSVHKIGPRETRNKRSVWTVPTAPYPEAHFACFPPALIEPCILASSRPGDTVLDPFFGSGTTGQVAQALGRQWIGCDLNPEYEQLQRDRTRQTGMVL